MSARAAGLISCDGGCGNYVYGDNITAARAAASENGWSFVKRVKKGGEPSARSGDDVCPACLPEFTARPSRRHDRWEGLTPEERRIKTLLNMHWQVLSRDERDRLESQLAGLAAKRDGAGGGTAA